MIQALKNWNFQRKLKREPLAIQKFISKYGSYLNHYDFKSKDSDTQVEFLKDYFNYLQVHTNISEELITVNAPYYKSCIITFSASVLDRKYNYTVFFSRDGDVLYECKCSDGSSSMGNIGISFEINIPKR